MEYYTVWQECKTGLSSLQIKISVLKRITGKQLDKLSKLI